MPKKLVSIRDSKVETFSPPTLVHNLAEGERFFEDLKSDSNSLVGKHPADFTLWCVAEFDETSGVIVTEGHPFKVC